MDMRFVSETDLESARRKRQEEWEKTRKPDDPLEAPEPVYDPRSLYERLQEQKYRKQEEFEESRKLKNLIRGLDDEEMSFLEMVDQTKMEEEMTRNKEEKDALEEFRKAITDLSEDEQTRRLEEFKKSFSLKMASSVNKKPRKSSTNPLANLIKLKDDSGKCKSVDGKRTPEKSDPKESTESSKHLKQLEETTEESKSLEDPQTPREAVNKVKSGLVDYGSDSDESHGSEDDDSREGFSSKRVKLDEPS